MVCFLLHGLSIVDSSRPVSWFCCVDHFYASFLKVVICVNIFCACFLRILIRESNSYHDSLLFIIADFYSFCIGACNSVLALCSYIFFSAFKLLDFKKVVLINRYLLCNVVLFLLYNRMHQRYVYIVLLPDETSSHTLISPL